VRREDEVRWKAEPACRDRQTAEATQSRDVWRRKAYLGDGNGEEQHGDGDEHDLSESGGKKESVGQELFLFPWPRVALALLRRGVGSEKGATGEETGHWREERALLLAGSPASSGFRPPVLLTQCPRRLPEHRAGTAKSHDNGARLGTPPAYRNETRMPGEECAVWSVLMAAGLLRGLHKKEKRATRKCEETPLDGLGAARGWSSRRAGQRAGSPRIARSPLMDASGLAGAFAAG
jgi:hypothetical protein